MPFRLPGNAGARAFLVVRPRVATKHQIPTQGKSDANELYSPREAGMAPRIGMRVLFKMI